MGRFTIVKRGLCEQEDVRSMSPVEKCVYLTVMTLRRQNIAGLVYITVKELAQIINSTEKEVEQALEGANLRDRLEYFRDYTVLWVKDFIRQQFGRGKISGKQRRGILNRLMEFPDSIIRKYLIYNRELLNLKPGDLEDFDMELFPDTLSDTSNKEPEPKKETVKRKPEPEPEPEKEADADAVTEAVIKPKTEVCSLSPVLRVREEEKQQENMAAESLINSASAASLPIKPEINRSMIYRELLSLGMEADEAMELLNSQQAEELESAAKAGTLGNILKSCITSGGNVDKAESEKKPNPEKTLPTQKNDPSGKDSLTTDMTAQQLKNVLIEMGVNRKNAGRLVKNFDNNAVFRQIVWLPLRNARTPGALVRAIEEDWEKPIDPGEVNDREKASKCARRNPGCISGIEPVCEFCPNKRKHGS